MSVDVIDRQTNSSAYAKRVPLKIKTIYAVGASAESIIGIAFNIFSFFFYTNIMGVPGTLAGLAITIALVFDAITDPLVGSFSDRWRSKLGRRHPFMFAAPVPVMVCLFLIYSPPDTLDSFGLFMWLTVFTVLMRSCMTLFQVPHLALGAELSADFTERSRVMGINSLFGAIGGMGIAIIAYSFFFSATPEYPNGLLNRPAYSTLAISAAAAGGLLMLFSTVFTMGLIPRLPKPALTIPRFSFKEFLLDCNSTIANRNYLVLLVGYLFLSATIGTRETINLHMSTYYWELLPHQIRYIPLFGIIAPIIGFAITPALHEKFEKKPILIAGLIGILLFASAPIVLRMLGWFPENHTAALLPTLIVFFLLMTTSQMVVVISAMSALADIADEQALMTGRRQEGVFYAARSFFAKASSGLGTLLAGIAIDIIEFPIGEKAGSIAADKLFQLGLVDGPLAIIPGAIGIFFYIRYSLSRKRHTDIQDQLKQRHDLKAQ